MISLGNDFEEIADQLFDSAHTDDDFNIAQPMETARRTVPKVSCFNLNILPLYSKYIFTASQCTI